MSSFSSLFFSAWPHTILKITSQVCFNWNFFALFRNSCIQYSEVILTHLEQILNCFHLFVTCVGIKIYSKIMSFSCNLSKINIVCQRICLFETTNINMANIRCKIINIWSALPFKHVIEIIDVKSSTILLFKYN
jgi:hypothetical protein